MAGAADAAGLFVHGSLWLPATPLFSVIGDVSQAFRMGVFYAISGFLTSLALERRASAPWLPHRLIQLGVPALFGLAALSPLIWYTVMSSQGAAFGSLLPFDWHHLWFLFGLMLYSVLAVALHRTDRRLNLIRRLDRFTDARSGRIAVLMVAFVSACLLGAAPTVMLVTLPPNYIRSFGNIRLSPVICPYSYSASSWRGRTGCDCTSFKPEISAWPSAQA